MAKNQAQAEAIREAVRDVIAINPLLGSRTIARAVSQKLNIPVTDHYVLKVMQKARKQAIEETSRELTINEIASIREVTRMVTDRLSKIVFAKDGEATNSERIYAGSQLLFYRHKMFSTMQDAGIFKRAPVEIKHEHTLSPELQMVFENARRWGMTRVNEDNRPKPEPVVMVDAAVIESSTGEVTNTNESIERKIIEPGPIPTPKQSDNPPDPDAQKRLDAILADMSKPNH